MSRGCTPARVPRLADQRRVLVRVRQHLEQELLLQLDSSCARGIVSYSASKYVLSTGGRFTSRSRARAGRSATRGRAPRRVSIGAPAELLLHELPRHRVDRPGVALGIRARELARAASSSGSTAPATIAANSSGKSACDRAPFGREHLGAAGAALVEAEREHLVDPRLERSARRAALRRVARARSRVRRSRLVLVHREHELVLRAEVPVERARREAGFGEHVGDGEAGGAALAQHAETGLDQRAHFVLGAALPGRHRSCDRSLRNRHTQAENDVFNPRCCQPDAVKPLSASTSALLGPSAFEDALPAGFDGRRVEARTLPFAAHPILDRPRLLAGAKRSFVVRRKHAPHAELVVGDDVGAERAARTASARRAAPRGSRGPTPAPSPRRRSCR